MLAVFLTGIAIAALVIPRYGVLPSVEVELPGGIPADPVAHALICMTLATVWGLALHPDRYRYLLVGAVLLAIALEGMQALPFVQRGVEWLDLYFNVAGAILGVGLARLIADWPRIGREAKR